MEKPTSSTMDKQMVCMSAIDKELTISIPQATEIEGVKSYVLWGSDNQYPEYLNGLFQNVSSLKTIIMGTADYVAGDDALFNINGFEREINRKGDTARDLITLIARDYLIYGGYAIQVIRNKVGAVCELYYIDFRYLRSSKKNDLFWYSEEYGKKYMRANKTVVFPKFIKDGKEPSSIVYVTNTRSQTYPIPRYSGALKSCEIERNIDEFHLSALENGFGSSYIINFLNGIPNDEQKEEIEKNITEKFAGASNAGRIMLNFANHKDNATTVEKLDVTDFGEKYKAASDRAREQIFTAFSCTPVLFGISNNGVVFNKDNYKEAFKLYSSTMVRAIQRTICDTMDKIFDTKGCLTIKPFNIDWEIDGEINNVN